MEQQTPPVERRRSITRIFGKMKTALRSGRTSASGPSVTQPTSSSNPTTISPAVTTEPQPTPTEPLHVVLEKDPAIIEVDDAFLNDRLATLLAKYNLDILYDSSAQRQQPQERVEKQIRMRVRYTCHQCSTTFGSQKECVSCHHRRCTQCARRPPKRVKKAVELVEMVETVEPVTEGAAPQTSTAGHERHCTCHMCQTDIAMDVQICPNCQHEVCERCLRETVDSPQPAPQEAEAITERPQTKAVDAQHVTATSGD